MRIHDAAYIRGDKRFYMTATPRIYDDASKAKAGEASAVPPRWTTKTSSVRELHRLGFGEAVAQDLLADYKVLVLAVDEDRGLPCTFQLQLADEGNELRPTTPPRSSAVGTARLAGSAEHSSRLTRHRCVRSRLRGHDQDLPISRSSSPKR